MHLSLRQNCKCRYYTKFIFRNSTSGRAHREIKTGNAEMHTQRESMWVSPLVRRSTEKRLCCAQSLSPVWLSNSMDLQPSRLPCPWAFSRQEYCSGLLCPPPGDLPNPGTEPRSSALQVNSLLSEPPGKPIDLESLHASLCFSTSFSISGLLASFSSVLCWVARPCLSRLKHGNLENSAVATGLENVSFHSNPKER